jgi:hypothetical protein
MMPSERKLKKLKGKSKVPYCQWFLLCTSPATGTTPHSVLGDVPTCDRCHQFATGAVRASA